MLKETLEQLELKDGDTHKTAFLKGFAEGALEGLVILGALTFLNGVFSNKKSDK